MFVLVSEIEESSVWLEEFFVNKSEYDRFAYSINSREETETNTHSYDYQYRREKIRKDCFCCLFGFEDFEEWSIDALNGLLKNVSIKRSGDYGSDVVFNSESRITVNNYFDERRYIFNKTNENFPLVFEDEALYDSAVFRMYNVGQANMSALLFGDEKFPAMIFDLGKSRKCNEAIDLLQNRLPASGSGRTTTIVVSHFDNDHINMAGYIPYEGRSLQLLCPEFLHQSDIYKPSIQLLFYRIIRNGNMACVFLNDRLINQITRQYVTFLQGSKTKRDRNQSTDENSHGLITLLSINGKKVLVPGDVLYEDIFTRIPSPLDPNYVIIPHHACKYLDKIDQSILDLSRLEESFTFCGPHGGFHHPNKTHFEQYYSIVGAKTIRLIRPNRSSSMVYDHSLRISDFYYSTINSSHYDWKLK